MSNKILAEYLPVDILRPFEGHPFQVKDDEEMNQLVWSIITQGVLNPIMVRPLDTGEYEVISGHRRVHACRKGLLRSVNFVTGPFSIGYLSNLASKAVPCCFRA